MSKQNELLSLPTDPALLLLENDSVFAVRFLKRHDFINYCKARDLDVSKERLDRFEQHNVFTPIFRVFAKDDITQKLRFPNAAVQDWIKSGALIDTIFTHEKYEFENLGRDETEAFYSPFQIDWLSHILTSFTMKLHLDSYLNDDTETDRDKREKFWQEISESSAQRWQQHQFRRTLPVLCHFIANRYYAYTQSNKRNIAVSSGSSENPWMSVSGWDWDWHNYARSFDAQNVEKLFDLTPEKLKHAYEALGASASFCDPLDNWANLVEFVSLKKKQTLKGKALRAQSYRDAANMLRLLHKDLYGEELRPTHQIFGEVINHFPELEAREDVRKYLEFVVNQYDLNPRPKMVLFVEGESELALINAIFYNYYGYHPGRAGIELVNLRGVNNATGDKKADRFRAIIRLVDYLHHHQTMTFLVLDRENYAEKLKANVAKAKSLHGEERLAVPKEHIVLWKTALEFDNFSDTEIAKAMSHLAGDNSAFSRAEVKLCRESENPGKSLSDLYETKIGYGLEKPKLAGVLAKIMLDPKTRRLPKNRPIIKILNRVRLRAARNPFPTRQDTWELNQQSYWLGGPKRKLKPPKR
jgi:hypothetical protein